MGRNMVDLALQCASGPALTNAIQVIWLPGISYVQSKTQQKDSAVCQRRTTS